MIKHNYFVGQPIIFREDGHPQYQRYTYNHYLDEINSINGLDVVTKNGIKLRISTSNNNYGSLVLKGGKFPDNKFNNIFHDLIRPSSLKGSKSEIVGSYRIYSIVVDTYDSEQLRQEYISRQLRKHNEEYDFAYNIVAHTIEQERKRKIALKDYFDLLEKQEPIKEDLKKRLGDLDKEAYNLRQDLIKKHCKRYSIHDSNGETYYYCEEW